MSMLARAGAFMGISAGLCWGESLLSARILAKYVPAIVAPSPMLGGLVSKLYGCVVMVNVVGSSIMLMRLSFIPGSARKVYIEKAKAAGDKEAEERFSLPKMYAEGFSKEAKEFNCHQRAHQQALETYTNFVVCSLIGGIRHPLLTTAAGVLYIVARLKWAEVCVGGGCANASLSVRTSGRRGLTIKFVSVCLRICTCM